MSEAADNRLRRPASAIPAITGLRFMPQGTQARLVNISETGLLAESSARFPVGAPVTVSFEGMFTPQSVEGRVVRCEVAVMGPDGRLRYHNGIEFDQIIVLDEPQSPDCPVDGDGGVVVNRW